MYVFGKRFPSIVDVDEQSSDVSFIIRYEDPPLSGKYHTTTLGKHANGYATELLHAEIQLQWIAAGNEFPT